MKSNLKLIQQGAEAKIFLDEENNLIIKDRISKSYRIKELDDKIRKTRTKAEKKLLEKASKIINAPDPLPLKEINIIKMPFIEGKKLSEHLDNFPLEKQKQIMKETGESIAKLHKADIIHGDLTTSNMILVSYNSEGGLGDNPNDNNLTKKDKDILINPKQISRHEVSANISGLGREGGNNLNPKDFKTFFIDFGLGYISKKIEDKAVDLHLLKQALEAKHFEHWKILFQEVEENYSENHPEAKIIFERLTAVERRGRYRH